MKQFSLTDDLGILHKFDAIPQRIISLVPSQTELLVDLGLESKIVGITKFCVHPENLRKHKTIVGGTKKVDYDKIKALNPDIIICNKEENTLEIVENLRKITTVWVTNVITIEDNQKMISDFGNLFGCVAEAGNWNQKITLALNDFKQFIENKPIQKVAYFIWKNPYMVAGSNTFINELLQLNRFENVYANQSRYPEVDIENSNEDVDFVFLSSEPYPFKEKDVLEMTHFCPETKIFLVDGEMFSWHGSRLLKALNYFKELHQRL
ncbi:ABC transporter substrate-binding protein [Flavobacterium seoulense]|uniref:Iron ABC transporter n=1 Tax=Flavobacterium seoulense TaxID=1492738 RepID=A0A066WQG0_9FLAO|nr:helical backbone metal receptor [Flavobacterium seoulense]KDN56076.1 iron ABC transporter [Flavobacterium seoulense]